MASHQHWIQEVERRIDNRRLWGLVVPLSGLVLIVSLSMLPATTIDITSHLVVSLNLKIDPILKWFMVVALLLAAVSIGFFANKLSMAKKPQARRGRATKVDAPPESGDYLLYLLIPSRDRAVMAREMEETYLEILHKHGKRQAIFWYWTRVVGNIVACSYKPVLKIASISGITAVLKHTGIVKSLLKKIGLG
jgi:hypothetical protein